jgi:hypothetical protein
MTKTYSFQFDPECDNADTALTSVFASIKAEMFAAQKSRQQIMTAQAQAMAALSDDYKDRLPAFRTYDSTQLAELAHGLQPAQDKPAP